MKTIGLTIFVMLFLTGCVQSVGMGIGGVVGSVDGGMVASEVHTNSQTGTHGSISMGRDIRL